MALRLKKGTTSKLGLVGLKDANDSAVTNATVQAWLYDRNNQEVGDSTFPISLTHDSGGNYYGTIPAAIDVKAGSLYTVKIVAESSSLTGEWRYKVYCEYADGE